MKEYFGPLDFYYNLYGYLKMRLDDFLLLVREWTDSHYILLLFETNECKGGSIILCAFHNSNNVQI